LALGVNQYIIEQLQNATVKKNWFKSDPCKKIIYSLHHLLCVEYCPSSLFYEVIMKRNTFAVCLYWNCQNKPRWSAVVRLQTQTRTCGPMLWLVTPYTTTP